MGTMNTKSSRWQSDPILSNPVLTWPESSWKQVLQGLQGYRHRKIWAEFPPVPSWLRQIPCIILRRVVTRRGTRVAKVNEKVRVYFCVKSCYRSQRKRCGIIKATPDIAVVVAVATWRLSKQFADRPYVDTTPRTTCSSVATYSSRSYSWESTSDVGRMSSRAAWEITSTRAYITRLHKAI